MQNVVFAWDVVTFEMDDLEKELLNGDYLISLDALIIYKKLVEAYDMFEYAKRINDTFHAMAFDYVDFRLREYDSEARSVIKKVYKVLGYNPYNPKQIGGRK